MQHHGCGACKGKAKTRYLMETRADMVDERPDNLLPSRHTNLPVTMTLLQTHTQKQPGSLPMCPYVTA
jgi:hypothetical protein